MGVRASRRQIIDHCRAAKTEYDQCAANEDRPREWAVLDPDHAGLHFGQLSYLLRLQLHDQCMRSGDILCC